MLCVEHHDLLLKAVSRKRSKNAPLCSNRTASDHSAPDHSGAEGHFCLPLNDCLVSLKLVITEGQGNKTHANRINEGLDDLS